MKDSGLTIAFLLETLLVASCLMLPAAAWADSGVLDGGAAFLDDGTVEAEYRFERGSDDDSPASTGVAEPSGMVWIGVPRMGNSGDPSDGNGGLCRRLEWVQVPREEAQDRRARAEADYLASFPSLALDREGMRPNVPCPEDPADALPVAMVEETLTAVVRDQLPRPVPSLPPGHAIVGLRTYLVTGHDLTYGPVTTTVDLGPVSFEVRFEGEGSSSVDWGDGTVTSHDVPGTGYPHGPIHHTYVDAGLVDITVTDRWHVTYDAGPFVGTLLADLAPVTLADVEIQQRQPVRIH